MILLLALIIVISGAIMTGVYGNALIVLGALVIIFEMVGARSKR